MTLLIAIGAVVEGSPTTFHTPDSGHFSPVLAVRPTAMSLSFLLVAITQRQGNRARFNNAPLAKQEKRCYNLLREALSRRFFPVYCL